MARYAFGGTVEDYVASATGARPANRQALYYLDSAMTQPYTDFTSDRAGTTPVSQIVTDTQGFISRIFATVPSLYVGAVSSTGAPPSYVRQVFTSDDLTTTATPGDIGAVAKAGDTMTGPLTLSGAPTSGLHASTKTYVDAETTRATAAEALAAQKSANLSDLASAATARTNLGLGTAATQPTSAFDAAGLAGTEQTRATAAELARLLPRGAWVTGTVYAVNDEVTANGVAWRCVVAHTAGATFSADPTKWERFGVGQVVTTAPSSPTTDDLWYDKTNDLWKRWSGTGWKAEGSVSYIPILTDPETVAYNPDGTVSTVTVQGVATTYTYNADGTVHTETRNDVTRTYTYTGGNLTAVA